MTVWYFEPYDEIWVRRKNLRIERGQQGMIKAGELSVPDYLNLFTWGVFPAAWQKYKRKGYLVRLGNL